MSATFGFRDPSPAAPLAPERSVALELAEARCVQSISTSIRKATGARADTARTQATNRCALLFEPSSDGRMAQREG